jgi:hypothetical protein
MTTPKNDIKAIENRFANNLGNGQIVGETLLSLYEAAEKSRDTTIITRAILRANKKKDKHIVSLMRHIIACVWPGAKLSSKDNKLSLKISGIQANEEAMTGLKSAVASGLSARGSKFKETVGVVARVSAEKTPAELQAAFRKRTEKWAEDNGFTLAQLAGILTAKPADVTVNH